MFVLPIVLASTFLEEISETMGKKGVRQRHETVANLAFLLLFWALIFLVAATALGAKFVINPKSLPLLAARVVIEIALNYTAATAIVRADRSTLSFMRTLTIPLVLATDVILGYHLTQLQIAGVCVLFTGLAATLYHNADGRRGSGLGILVAFLAATSATLYKWDISHYNSVTGEQIVIYTSVLVFFYAISIINGTSPIKLLLRPATGVQSISNGLGLAIESFAFSFAPASVVVALKRTLAVVWSILFGHRFFHEQKVKKKMVAGAVLAVGLALLVSPYI